MKTIIITFFIFLFTNQLFPQKWIRQNTSTDKEIRQIFFTDPYNGFAAGEDGIFLKTTDGGNNWSLKSVGSETFIGCYFTDKSSGWITGDGGIYKTTDGGETWIPKTGVYSATKVFFANPNLGWVVGGIDGQTPMAGYIFKTSNNGETWSVVENNTSWARFYGVQFVDNETGWAYTEKNGLLVKTTDGGANWTTQLNYGTATAIRGMYFTDNNKGWVSGRTNSAGVLLKTTDGGATWTDMAAGVPAAFSDIKFFNENEGLVIGKGRDGSGSLYKTIDGGLNWSAEAMDINAPIKSAFFLNQQNIWVYGDSGYIYKYNGITDVSETSPVHEFALDQNYPNPFNPATAISYKISSEVHVYIKVYDILGNEIAVLADEIKAPGKYTVHFDGKGLAGGIYYYSMKAGGYSKTLKLVLLK